MLRRTPTYRKGCPYLPGRLAHEALGSCPDRLRLEWRCPLAAANKTPDGTARPHFARDCSDSAYRHVLYTYPRQNHGLHSCAERSVMWKTNTRHLPETRTAGRDRWFFRVILAAMCQHIRAWATHAADRLN